MAPEQREARLRQLELTFHLDALMKTPPAGRSERLKLIPPDLKPIVDEALKQWDLLPPHLQQDALEHETTSNYFLRVRANDPSRARVAARPDRETEQARRLAEHFKRFFELPADEQKKTLEALPAAEREEMEKSLKAFADLPPAQQKICIDSFEKLSQMSKDARDQFLKSAARWRAMSPRERETFRVLVSILPSQAGVSLPPALPPKSDEGLASASKSPLQPK
jgi:hypothetical protein